MSQWSTVRIQAVGLWLTAVLVLATSPAYRLINPFRLPAIPVATAVTVLLVWTWCAIITLVLYLRFAPETPFDDMAASIVRTATTAIWLAPMSLFSRQRPLVPLLGFLVLTAMLTRLFYGEWESAGKTMRKAPPGIIAAFCLQFAVVSYADDHTVRGAALLATFVILVVWSALSTGAAKAREPRTQAQSARAIALAMLFCVLLVLVRVFPFHAPRARLAGTRPNAPAEPEEAPPPSALAASTDGTFPGVILLPEVRPVPVLIAPRPKGLGVGTQIQNPYVIPFGGEYWIYRHLFSRPPRNSWQRKGNPTQIGFETVDRWPLEMQARQRFDQPIDLACCHAVRIEIWNADRYPGTLRLQLFAVNEGKSHFLGGAPVRTEAKFQGAKVQAVPESLNFEIPPGTGPAQELQVIIALGPPRTEHSARIAIERFVLLP